MLSLAEVEMQNQAREYWLISSYYYESYQGTLQLSTLSKVLSDQAIGPEAARKPSASAQEGAAPSTPEEIRAATAMVATSKRRAVERAIERKTCEHYHVAFPACKREASARPRVAQQSPRLCLNKISNTFKAAGRLCAF